MCHRHCHWQDHCSPKCQLHFVTSHMFWDLSTTDSTMQLLLLYVAEMALNFLWAENDSSVSISINNNHWDWEWWCLPPPFKKLKFSLSALSVRSTHLFIRLLWQVQVSLLASSQFIYLKSRHLICAVDDVYHKQGQHNTPALHTCTIKTQQYLFPALKSFIVFSTYLKRYYRGPV